MTQRFFLQTSIVVWFAGLSFGLFQFFLQLSSGIIIESLMKEMTLNAFLGGLLSSAFYYIYAAMQIPVGILLDRFNTRTLLAGNALLCSIGCYLFAHSQTFYSLFLARIITGAGAAFAFVGLSHLIRQHFAKRQFAFMMGLSETLGFVVTMLGIFFVGQLITQLGWRFFINGAAYLGFFIAFCCWYYIPNHYPPTTENHPIFAGLNLLFGNRLVWLNGLFAALSFAIITVFAALWAVPFLQLKLHCSLGTASLVDSLLFLGSGLSCPLYGYLNGLNLQRRKSLIWSCLGTACCLLCVIAIPTKSAYIYGTLFFLIGIFSGAYMLAYTIANEITPKEAQSTAAGFTNTLAISSTAILQPFIGYSIDSLQTYAALTPLQSYQWTLLIIPVMLFIAARIANYLPDKKLHDNTSLQGELIVS